MYKILVSKFHFDIESSIGELFALVEVQMFNITYIRQRKKKYS